MSTIFRIVLSIFLLCLIFSVPTSAQQLDSLNSLNITDTVKKSFRSVLKESAIDRMNTSREKYREDTIRLKQYKIYEELVKTNRQVKVYLKKGIDTQRLARRLKSVAAIYEIVKDGIFINKGTAQTQRNLSISAGLLTRLIEDMTRQKDEIDTYTNGLSNYRNKIDSLQSDTAGYIFPSDLVKAIKYLIRLKVIAKEVNPIDTAMDKALSNIQDLQTKTDFALTEFKIASEEVEAYRLELSKTELKREFDNIWGPVGYFRPFNQIIDFSVAKEMLSIQYYINDNIGKLIVMLLLILASTVFIRSVKEKIILEGKFNNDFKDQLVLRYPALSAILIVVSLFQFCFFEPPFIFYFGVWTVLCICLTIIFRNFITRHWMIFWIITVTLFVAAGLDNMILQASRTERWIMFGISLSGIIYGSYILLSGHRQELREKYIIYFIVFMILLELASLIFNVEGRYNISKALMISGYVGVIVAILFLWGNRLINEGLCLASSIYKQPDKNLLYLNFDRVGNKTPFIFYVALVIGWMVLVGNNFYSFKQLSTPLNEFLTQSRTIGSYSFTINGIFVFLIITVCSFLLSRLISFFASDPGNTHNNIPGKKNVGLGSWILLIRIGVITLGMLLAFAASGIPLDKITIVIGALGVGIGLGLQGLVNNLVSGLVIAFERPVKVGDSIEVNGKSGTMQSIGFRSSIITLDDGAALVIPNGDLLNHQLINWTTGKNSKRLSITVGVEYNSDLEQVKGILNNILQSDERIAKYPAPVVVAKEFGTNSIDFQVVFWLHNIGQSAVVTSDIISKINSGFKEAGIIIPIPRQDLYIRSEENILPKTKKKPDQAEG